jgi:hypothetical protein
MMELERPKGLGMWFFSLDHCPDAECKFASRSLGGQEPGQSYSFGHFAWNCGLIEPTPNLEEVWVRHFAERELRLRRYRVWANHLRRLDAGSTYESSASYRHWKLHGSELEENWDTINVSHEVRAEQIRRRSRSQSRRRKALEKERAPQTTAGRLAEGARSATEWAQHQEIQTERASSSGGVIAVPTLTPWHDLPGGTISKWLG